MASIGGGRHVFYLTAAQQLEAVKWSWISQPIAIVLFAPGKASVAILTLRFMSRTYNIAADIVLALLPATIIGKLNLHPRKKIALCVLLGLGLICAVFSAIKLPYLVDLTSRSDFTWSAYDVEMWTGAEAFVMMVCGNIPPLQPLWDSKISGSRKVHGPSSYERTPPKGHSGASYSVTTGSKATIRNPAESQTQYDDLEMLDPKVSGWPQPSARTIMATTGVDVTYRDEA
ncbi:hypothetical protein SLS53_003638 [Cytospora paraplurivora]|uniref:Rhodopsin domain-containing protein n=1 Tax=Cytospora paraplurivora TaxID=2898453 RepID=A0AAN9UCH7_9PEZI